MTTKKRMTKRERDILAERTEAESTIADLESEIRELTDIARANRMHAEKREKERDDLVVRIQRELVAQTAVANDASRAERNLWKWLAEQSFREENRED